MQVWVSEMIRQGEAVPYEYFACILYMKLLRVVSQRCRRLELAATLRDQLGTAGYYNSKLPVRWGELGDISIPCSAV